MSTANVEMMDDGDELVDHCAVAERKGLPQAEQPKAKSAPSSSASASSSTCAAATISGQTAITVLEGRNDG